MARWQGGTFDGGESSAAITNRATFVHGAHDIEFSAKVLAGPAYLPLIHAILGGRLADASGRLAAILVLSIILLLTGVAVAIYPRPKPTELGYVRETVKRCARGAACGIALAWSVFTRVDGSAFGDSAEILLVKRTGSRAAAMLLQVRDGVRGAATSYLTSCSC